MSNITRSNISFRAFAIMMFQLHIYKRIIWLGSSVYAAKMILTETGLAY